MQPLKNDADYKTALREVSPYFDNEPEPGTPEFKRFDALVTAIEQYEAKHYPIGPGVAAYPLAIEPGNDATAFGAVLPDIPGAVSAGDTREEARLNVLEAAYIVIEDMRARGESVPVPGSIEAHQANADFAGWEWDYIELATQEGSNAD